jgi:DNA-binding transcriptional LysR family regulator
MQHQQGDDIGVFLAVCNAGSFVAASVRLRLSASAVAKAIGRIEKRLGIRLFKRTTRSLSLTAEGAAYRDVCETAWRDIHRVETVISGLSEEPAGTLNVSLPPLFGSQIVAPPLYALTRAWPRLNLNISTSVEHINLSDSGIDLAVRIGELPDASGLIARQLGVQRLVLCGSRSYFDGRTPPETIEDLADHDLIGAPRNGRPAVWQFRQSGGEVSTWHPRARLLLEGSLLTLSAIRSGQGLGLLPYWLVRDEISSGRLVSVLEDRIAGHLPVHAVWPAAPIMLLRLRVAIDAIVEAAAPELSSGANEAIERRAAALGSRPVRLGLAPHNSEDLPS